MDGRPPPLCLPGGGGDSGPLDPFSTVQTPTGSSTIEEGSIEDFAARVHTDVEQMWTDLFQRAGRDYRHSTLVLFTQSTQSACGGVATWWYKNRDVPRERVVELVFMLLWQGFGGMLKQASAD